MVLSTDVASHFKDLDTLKKIKPEAVLSSNDSLVNIHLLSLLSNNSFMPAILATLV